ncbi:MAG: hypothetical protein DRI90_14100 [Deltaproteobacteria bacterium]|nr:MAG: hypothetical protein DRI90_14100 [Deltaproteobacteria bacterium]
MRRSGLIAMVGLVALGVSCQLMSGLADLGLGDQATGTACTHLGQCLSEQCIDQVCCETVCDTPCSGCNQAGSEGLCTPYPVRTDPDGDCPGMGLCDGSGTCAEGNHLWSLRFGDWDPQSAYAVAVDDDRNIVVVGTYQGTVDFSGTPLSSIGDGNLFVAKLSPAGELLWAKGYGDTAAQEATGVAIDGQGNIAVAGRHHGTLDFPDGSSALVAEPEGSHFLALFNAEGGAEWSRSVPGRLWPRVAIDHSSGDVVMAGRLTDEATFGSDTLTPVWTEDIYVARFSPAGDLRWSAHIPSEDVETDPDQVVSLLGGLAIDSQGAVLLAGGFLTQLTFGSEVLRNESVGADIFVAKLDADGDALWAKRYGGDEGLTQFVSGFALDDDHLVLVGAYVGLLSLGPSALPSSGWKHRDVFVARLSPDGEHLLSRGFPGGLAVDEDHKVSLPTGVAVDAVQGNIVVTGVLASSLNFGGEVLKTAGSYDMFFAKLSPTAEHLYSKRYGDGNEQFAFAGAIDSQGDVVIAGHFQTTLDFGAATSLQSEGEFDIFVAKFTP